MKYNKKQEKLIFIHGANSTPTSFNYIVANLPQCEIQYIDYDTNDGFYYNLEKMINSLDPQQDYKVCSHSMGGMYAMHLLQHIRITRAVSIATPFKGAAIADWAKYMMPMYQLFRDVSTRSLPVTQIQEIEVNIPWTQIVTTRGNAPWLAGYNDGVVTKSSMTAKKGIEYQYLDCNHHEVLLSDRTVDIVTSKLF